MKTLKNILEGILQGQDETLQTGDKYASIIKKAETQLDELYSVCDNGGVSFFEFEKGVFWKYTKLEGCDLCLACNHNIPKQVIDDLDLKLYVVKRKYEKYWKVYFIKELQDIHRPFGNEFALMKVSFDDAKTFKQLMKKVLKPAFKDLDSFKKAFTIYEKS